MLYRFLPRFQFGKTCNENGLVIRSPKIGGESQYNALCLQACHPSFLFRQHLRNLLNISRHVVIECCRNYYIVRGLNSYLKILETIKCPCCIQKIGLNLTFLCGTRPWSKPLHTHVLGIILYNKAIITQGPPPFNPHYIFLKFNTALNSILIH